MMWLSLQPERTSVNSSAPSAPQVSLLEYRKRKQGGTRDSELMGGSSHARPGSYNSKDSHHSQSLASPLHSFSFSTHTAAISQVEEVSPSEHHRPAGKPKHQESNNQW